MKDGAAVTVRPGAPLSDEGRALIAASQEALEAVDPPEECFSFSPEELAVANCRFLVAELDGKPVGCVALMDMGDYGEVKRFYVDSAIRGRGIGTALMDAAESLARDLGLPRLKLETGIRLKAAVALYRARGYADCAPFGGYPDIASNLFLDREL